MTGNGSPPVHPRAFGEELRRLRSSSGLSLDDITSETKISRRILEALEAGRFQSLPDRVFSRNFVRQYAGTIGCDEQRLVEAFETAWERFELTSGTHPALLADDLVPGSPIRWRFWIPIGIGVLILIVAALVILRGTASRQTLLIDPRRVSDVIPYYRRRTRADWWPQRAERAVLSRILTRLAFRKHVVHHLQPDKARLAGLEVVHLRQRARAMLAPPPVGEP